MRMYDIIRKKRDGGELTDSEIRFFIDGYTKGEIPDYQASAFCMAVYFSGMSERETVTLTDAMAHSGDTVDLSRFGKLSCDKHSTGGVGDKTSLIVAPIVASLGAKITKMSGRGLGHTGGTVDKLESIKGYRTSLSADEFLEQIDKVGMAVIGQTGNLTPADKKLYALRDVTATVDSIPLITSSIMSKKLAAGSHNIVLDVKVGSGAFMKSVDEAKVLAENMVRIGKGCGRNIAALLTDMNTPLGDAIGNSLEVIEAAEVLKGNRQNDLYEVSVSLATEIISLCFGYSEDDARAKVIECINSKNAFKKMKEWVCAQGGDANCLDDYNLFDKAEFSLEVKANADGYIYSMNAEGIGIASVVLGAGRVSKDDSIDYSAGIILSKKTGDKVSLGDVLCTLYSNNEETLKSAEKQYLQSVKISKTKPEKAPLIYKIVR